VRRNRSNSAVTRSIYAAAACAPRDRPLETLETLDEPGGTATSDCAARGKRGMLWLRDHDDGGKQ
jgi:hypothetical protein